MGRFTTVQLPYPLRNCCVIVIESFIIIIFPRRGGAAAGLRTPTPSYEPTTRSPKVCEGYRRFPGLPCAPGGRVTACQGREKGRRRLGCERALRVSLMVCTHTPWRGPRRSAKVLDCLRRCWCSREGTRQALWRRFNKVIFEIRKKSTQNRLEVKYFLPIH